MGWLNPSELSGPESQKKQQLDESEHDNACRLKSNECIFN